MLAEELKQILHGEVSNSEADLVKYSRDASIFEIKPQVVVFPQGTADLEHLVKFVTAKKLTQPELSLTMRSGGTDMTGGSINDSIVIDTTAHLNHIVEIGSNFAVAEPGVYYRDFETALAQQGLLMPAYPASRGICALGGMVGNNAGGEKSLSYGQVINFVQSLEVVLADGHTYTFTSLNAAELHQMMKLQNFVGEIYRKVYDLVTQNEIILQQAKPSTSKNSSGYYLWDVWDGNTFDLTKLFTGSQGTLGLITKIKFRLVRPKITSQLLVIDLPEITELGKIVNSLKAHQPETLEIFDDHTMHLAMQYMPEIMPGLWAPLTQSIPRAVLLAEFSGVDAAEAEAHLMAAQKDVTEKFKVKSYCTKTVEEAQAYWRIRRESYNLLRQHMKTKVAAPFIEDIVVHPDQLPDFLPALDKIFGKYPGFTYSIAGHAGDANFHIFPLLDLTREEQREIVTSLSNEVYDLLITYNGSMSAEHNDGLIRGPFLPKMFGPEVCALFQQTKNIFDPLGIFNPHKKINADMTFFNEHLRRN
jgi:FAD/FMN-containing dehydrogenase